MFKQDPIVFRAEFKNSMYFKSFRDKDGCWIVSRDVLILPFTHNNGTGVGFKIEEHWSNKSGVIETPRIIWSIDHFDHQHHDLITDMAVLASGDVRGRHACAMAYDLFRKLFLFSDKMKELLPLVVENAMQIIEESKK